MKIAFEMNGEKKEIEVRKVMITDSTDKRFSIDQDIEHGLSIYAEDGLMYVEPNDKHWITVFQHGI